MFAASTYQNKNINPDRAKNNLFFQPQLTINNPNDEFEKEADEVAEKIVSPKKINNETPFFKPVNSFIQRQPKPDEEEPVIPDLRLHELPTWKSFRHTPTDDQNYLSLDPSLFHPASLSDTPGVDFITVNNIYLSRLIPVRSYFDPITISDFYSSQYSLYHSAFGDFKLPLIGHVAKFLTDKAVYSQVDLALRRDGFLNYDEELERKGMGMPTPILLNKEFHFDFKLADNNPETPKEREANEVAEKILDNTKENKHVVLSDSINISQIQRKCSHCEDEEHIQRKQKNNTETQTDKDLENYASSLTNSGHNLSPETNQFFSERIGYDFSNVKIHTNSEANNSAQSINALAYTTGNNIVFNQNQFNPQTDNGKKLLAHELTHVVQQNNSIQQKRIQRMELSPLIPNYAQIGDTCGAASVVAALTIWHNERRSSTGPNTVVATACNIILSYMIHNRTTLIRRIEGMSSVTMPAEDFYNDLKNNLTDMRERARTGSREINESDFQHLGLYLAFIFNSDGSGGMSSFEISELLNALHLSGRIQSYSTLDEILDSSLIADLGNDAVAQINWYSTTQLHAFIIGRLQDGNWYLYDQGQSPPFRIQEATYPELKLSFLQAIRDGRSWILRAIPAGAPIIIPPPWTGVRLLKRPGSLSTGYQHLIIPSDFLAEIDEGAFTTGERLECIGFAGAEYDLNKAKTMFRNYKRTHPDYNYSGLIIEMPRGVFSVYTANTVSEDNTRATSIDSEDSAGGKLARHIYYHAYLSLCSEISCAADFFTVY